MTNLMVRNSKFKMLLNRILTIILTFTLMFMLSITYATEGEQPEPGSNTGGNSVSDVVNNLNNGNGVYGELSNIAGILAWLGFIIAVFKFMQIGIMLIIGGGNGKSDAKKSLIPWAIGALVCLMFGSVGPWIMGIIIGMGSDSVFGI